MTDEAQEPAKPVIKVGDAELVVLEEHLTEDGVRVIDRAALVTVDVPPTIPCLHCGNLSFRTRTKLCDSCGYSEKRQ